MAAPLLLLEPSAAQPLQVKMIFSIFSRTLSQDTKRGILKISPTASELRSHSDYRTLTKHTEYTMMEFIKKAWGSGSSRGFKASAWVIAIGTFAAWQYFDNERNKRGVITNNIKPPGPPTSN